jgi:hypothetical protein
MDQVWLDVRMWTGLRGTFHPFMDVACPAPEPLPTVVGVWQQWAVACLGTVAAAEGWQAGRYHYSAEQRDDGGHALAVFARGTFDWAT